MTPGPGIEPGTHWSGNRTRDTLLKASLYFSCAVGILDILETKLSYNDFDFKILEIDFFLFNT